jgi:4-hydroxybenzoate polyprenyltransferase
MAFSDYLRMMRPHQWYKNLLVFLAIIFGRITIDDIEYPTLFLIDRYFPLVVGFVILCMISSAGYLINDIQDLDKDAAHPEKKDRPLPSGSASPRIAAVLAAGLMLGGLVLSSFNTMFFLVVILYIINSQAYNHLLRNYAVVDVSTIAIGFILRAIAGAFLIRVPFTSWLVIGVFFVALVLGFGKRKNELQLMGEDAAEHKEVFIQYTDKMLDQGILMSATWVVMFYALYCYENYSSVMLEQPVMLTVPFVAGIVLRYVYLLDTGSPVGRKPHLAIRDKGILLGGLLFGLMLVWTLFFWVPVQEFFLELFPPLFYW